MLAASTAIAVHAALLFASLSSLSGGTLSSESSGDDDDGAIQVTLAGKMGGGVATQLPQPDQPVSELMSRVAQTSPAATTSAQPKQMPMTKVPARLDDLIRTAAPGVANNNSAGRGSTSLNDGGQVAESRSARSKSRADTDQSNAKGDSLWGQIGPCWRKMPGRAAVPVTLEITLNRAGRLETPPKILRPADIVADEARLASEAKALAAVAACGPYRAQYLRDNQTILEVTFRYIP